MTDATGFDAYIMYSGLKMHFTGSYDYIKYNGKVKLTKENFERSKGKFQFYKLSRRYNLQDLRDFYISNFVDNTVEWVGELLTPECDERYKKWQKRTQSLTYRFKEDIMHMLDIWENPESMLKVTDGQYPPLLRECMIGVVSIETVIILDDILNFFPMWQRQISDDVIWPSWKMKLMKYRPFLNYEKAKFLGLLKEMLREHAEA